MMQELRRHERRRQLMKHGIDDDTEGAARKVRNVWEVSPDQVSCAWSLLACFYCNIFLVVNHVP